MAMERQLVESVIRAKLDKINKRLEALQDGQRTGRLGPRTIRARVHNLKSERQKLVVEMQRHGYKVN